MPRRFLVAVTALATLFAGLAFATSAAATPAPHVPAGLPRAIEPLAPYVAQTACSPTTKPGTAKLARLLAATYRGTSYNTVYACGTDGPVSEHYDGRAIDWMVSIRNSAQHSDALAVISWLLATDSHGNHYAMARRLGVQYLIYDNRIWGSWDGKWEAYNNCAKLTSRAYDTSCHRDHMHISLSWNGAMGRTTFWTGQVHADDYGPCRAADLNWATNTLSHSRPCPDYATVHAARGASATESALVKYSGAALRPGLTGPAVTAVQQALHVSATGTFGAVTLGALRHFEAAHRLPLTGGVSATAWRELLRTTR